MWLMNIIVTLFNYTSRMSLVCVVAVCSQICTNGRVCINTDVTRNINTCSCQTSGGGDACQIGLYASICVKLKPYSDILAMCYSGGSRIVLRGFVLGKEVEMPKTSRVGTSPSPKKRNDIFRWGCYILVHFHEL